MHVLSRTQRARGQWETSYNITVQGGVHIFVFLLNVLQQGKDATPMQELDCAKSTMPDVTAPKAAYRQIIALDTRFVGNRHSKGAVLYSAEARDLRGADVVLVITRNGDDVAEYIQHAAPGQVCICRSGGAGVQHGRMIGGCIATVPA
jgi:hypothetical protein